MPTHFEKQAGVADGLEHVVLITIDRPATKNALDVYHFRDLANAWKEVRYDDEIWLAVATGVERCFMAGAELKGYIPQITELAKEIGRGEVTEIDGCRLADGTRAVLRDAKIYKPIIAAINGPCVAGGMEMLGGVDNRIASDHAAVGVMEPKRGLFAGGGTTARLPRHLSFPAAMEFLLTAEAFPASRALALGLINEIVGEDELLERAFDWAHRITLNAPLAVQATKGKRAARNERNAQRCVQDRTGVEPADLRHRRCQGGTQGFCRKAPPQLDRIMTPSWRFRLPNASDFWRKRDQTSIWRWKGDGEGADGVCDRGRAADLASRRR